jgi:isoleucyl-tRNA synthetase
MADARLGAYEKELEGAEQVATLKGSELVGRRYTPLFPFFAETENAFQVLGAEFVTTEDGTGVVHMAPGFGEDDQNECNAVGIPTICPMDEHGQYTAEITPWVGRHVLTQILMSSRRSRKWVSSFVTTRTTTATHIVGVVQSLWCTARCHHGLYKSQHSVTAWWN